MRNSRVLIGLAIVLSLALAAPAGAIACECQASGPPCQNAFQSDAVFAGTVQSITALPDADARPLPPGSLRIPRAVRVEFAAVAGFRGVHTSTLSVVTAGSGPACGYEFVRGERYLVYARRSPDGAGLETSMCSRTRPLSEAAEDLGYLRTLSTPGKTGALVSGTIHHWERDLATAEPRAYGPVRDLFVSVRGLRHAAHAWTDAQGRYEVTLPPGQYEVTVFPPPGFSTRFLQQTVDIPDPRACAVADFTVQFDGRISGVVRESSGQLATGVTVELMAAESAGVAGRVVTHRASTDAGGRFEFTELSPGRYIAGVDVTRRIDPEIVYPTTFHPGTRDVASATVVQLDGGQWRDLEPMTLPSPRRPHRISGTVVFEDGTPASEVSITLRDGSATRTQVAASIRTERDGTFSFLVHERLSYVADASYRDEGKRRFTGTAGPFVASEDTAPLKVVLSSR